MNVKNETNQLHGIYIPIALAANNDLSWNEKAVYAVYYYFTFHGDLQLCTITKTALSKKLSLPFGTVKDICRRLKSKGYISTDGGIKTKALKNFEGFIGVEIQPHNNIMEGETNPQDKTEVERGSKSNPKGVEIQREGVEIQPPKGSKSNPIIKKENKEKIKKNKESFSISTYKGDDDKCSSSCLAEEPSLPDTSSALYEREMRDLRKLGELQEALKKYIPEGWQRSDVISMAKRFGWENNPVLEILTRCYFYNAIPLQPLLAYYKEQPQDEVSMKIYRVVKDRDLDEYTQFCTLLDTKGRATNANNK